MGSFCYILNLKTEIHDELNIGSFNWLCVALWHIAK